MRSSATAMVFLFLFGFVNVAKEVSIIPTEVMQEYNRILHDPNIPSVSEKLKLPYDPALSPAKTPLHKFIKLLYILVHIYNCLSYWYRCSSILDTQNFMYL